MRFDYYRDANAAFEAFKSGLVDVRTETDPTRWNTGYTFPAVKDGKITLEKVEQKTPPQRQPASSSTPAAHCSKTRVCERRW